MTQAYKEKKSIASFLTKNPFNKVSAYPLWRCILGLAFKISLKCNKYREVFRISTNDCFFLKNIEYQFKITAALINLSNVDK